MNYIPSLATLTNTLNEVRAQVYPRNETERKVYEALSSKNWGASTTLMHEIASDTFDYEKSTITMKLIWSSIDNPSRTWKQLFKALTLLDFLVKNGPERIVEETRDHSYTLRPLQDYNFYEGTVDKGSGVREKSKSLIELLGSNEQIRSEREKARQLRHKFIGISNDGASSGSGSNPYSGYGREDSSRYSSGGIDSDMAGRGGGGRYNSDSYSESSRERERYGDNNSRPTRFQDDDPSSRPSRGPEISSNRKGQSTYEDDEDEESRPKSKGGATKASAQEKTPTGKFKISIKSGGSQSATSSETVHKKPVTSKEPEVDLLGSEPDFFSSPAPPVPAATSAAAFDAFGIFILTSLVKHLLYSNAEIKVTTLHHFQDPLLHHFLQILGTSVLPQDLIPLPETKVSIWHNSEQLSPVHLRLRPSHRKLLLASSSNLSSKLFKRNFRLLLRCLCTVWE